MMLGINQSPEPPSSQMPTAHWSQNSRQLGISNGRYQQKMDEFQQLNRSYNASQPTVPFSSSQYQSNNGGNQINYISPGIPSNGSGGGGMQQQKVYQSMNFQSNNSPQQHMGLQSAQQQYKGTNAFSNAGYELSPTIINTHSAITRNQQPGVFSNNFSATLQHQQFQPAPTAQGRVEQLNQLYQLLQSQQSATSPNPLAQSKSSLYSSQAELILNAQSKVLSQGSSSQTLPQQQSTSQKPTLQQHHGLENMSISKMVMRDQLLNSNAVNTLKSFANSQQTPLLKGKKFIHTGSVEDQLLQQLDQLAIPRQAPHLISHLSADAVTLMPPPPSFNGMNLSISGGDSTQSINEPSSRTALSQQKQQLNEISNNNNGPPQNNQTLTTPAWMIPRSSQLELSKDILMNPEALGYYMNLYQPNQSLQKSGNHPNNNHSAKQRNTSNPTLMSGRSNNPVITTIASLGEDRSKEGIYGVTLPAQLKNSGNNLVLDQTTHTYKRPAPVPKNSSSHQVTNSYYNTSNSDYQNLINGLAKQQNKLSQVPNNPSLESTLIKKETSQQHLQQPQVNLGNEELIIRIPISKLPDDKPNNVNIPMTQAILDKAQRLEQISNIIADLNSMKKSQQFSSNLMQKAASPQPNEMKQSKGSIFQLSTSPNKDLYSSTPQIFKGSDFQYQSNKNVTPFGGGGGSTSNVQTGNRNSLETFTSAQPDQQQTANKRVSIYSFQNQQVPPKPSLNQTTERSNGQDIRSQQGLLNKVAVSHFGETTNQGVTRNSIYGHQSRIEQVLKDLNEKEQLTPATRAGSAATNINNGPPDSVLKPPLAKKPTLPSTGPLNTVTAQNYFALQEQYKKLQDQFNKQQELLLNNGSSLRSTAQLTHQNKLNGNEEHSSRIASPALINKRPSQNSLPQHQSRPPTTSMFDLNSISNRGGMEPSSIRQSGENNLNGGLLMHQKSPVESQTTAAATTHSGVPATKMVNLEGQLQQAPKLLQKQSISQELPPNILPMQPLMTEAPLKSSIHSSANRSIAKMASEEAAMNMSNSSRMPISKIDKLEIKDQNPFVLIEGSYLQAPSQVSLDESSTPATRKNLLDMELNKLAAQQQRESEELGPNPIIDCEHSPTFKQQQSIPASKTAGGFLGFAHEAATQNNSTYTTPTLEMKQSTDDQQKQSNHIISIKEQQNESSSYSSGGHGSKPNIIVLSQNTMPEDGPLHATFSMVLESVQHQEILPKILQVEPKKIENLRRSRIIKNPFNPFEKLTDEEERRLSWNLEEGTKSRNSIGSESSMMTKMRQTTLSIQRIQKLKLPGIRIVDPEEAERQRPQQPLEEIKEIKQSLISSNSNLSLPSINKGKTLRKKKSASPQQKRRQRAKSPQLGPDGLPISRVKELKKALKQRRIDLSRQRKSEREELLVSLRIRKGIEKSISQERQKKKEEAMKKKQEEQERLKQLKDEHIRSLYLGHDD